MSMRRLVLAFVAVTVVGLGLPGIASAEPVRSLGVTVSDAPSPPAFDSPSMSLEDRRRAIADGDLPEVLLPMSFNRGRHFDTRWYDERGQVYRSREVAMVLRAVENPEIDHHMEWRQRMVGLAVVPVLFGTPLLFAGDQLSLGVENYNIHRAAQIRKAAVATAR